QMPTYSSKTSEYILIRTKLGDDQTQRNVNVHKGISQIVKEEARNELWREIFCVSHVAGNKICHFSLRIHEGLPSS
ncbi:hypothetical protein M569_01638, partial [Genlisea aurea]